MSTCVVGHTTLKDEEKLAQYRAQAPATLAPWGGEHTRTDIAVFAA